MWACWMEFWNRTACDSEKYLSFLFRFPNLAVCNISRDSIRAALAIGITANQVHFVSVVLSFIVS